MVCSHHIFEKLCQADDKFLCAVGRYNQEAASATGPDPKAASGALPLDQQRFGVFSLNDLLKLHQRYPDLFERIDLFDSPGDLQVPSSMASALHEHSVKLSLLDRVSVQLSKLYADSQKLTGAKQLPNQILAKLRIVESNLQMAMALYQVLKFTMAVYEDCKLVYSLGGDKKQGTSLLGTISTLGKLSKQLGRIVLLVFGKLQQIYGFSSKGNGLGGGELITENIFTQVGLKDFQDLLFEPKIITALTKILKLVYPSAPAKSNPVTYQSNRMFQFILAFLSLYGRANQYQLLGHFWNFSSSVASLGEGALGAVTLQAR